MATREKRELTEKEATILVKLYDIENGHFSTYSLTQELYSVEHGTPEFKQPFNDVRTTIERLIMLGLVDGKRCNAGVDEGGVYFEELVLTGEGQRTAIEVKHTT